MMSQADRLLYHSTLGSGVVKKKERAPTALWEKQKVAEHAPTKLLNPKAQTLHHNPTTPLQPRPQTPHHNL